MDGGAPGRGRRLVAHATDDDAMLLWLNDRSPARHELRQELPARRRAASATTSAATRSRSPTSGLRTVYAGAAAGRYFHVPVGDSRAPDLFGVAQHGVVYTGGKGKIAEHGGAGQQDRNVPVLVASASGHGAR